MPRLEYPHPPEVRSRLESYVLPRVFQRARATPEQVRADLAELDRWAQGRPWRPWGTWSTPFATFVLVGHGASILTALELGTQSVINLAPRGAAPPPSWQQDVRIESWQDGRAAGTVNGRPFVIRLRGVMAELEHGRDLEQVERQAAIEAVRGALELKRKDQRRHAAGPWYSDLYEAVNGLAQEKFAAAQLKGALAKTKGVYQDEVQATGFDKWLDERIAANQPVTKQEALDYLRENQVTLTESVKSEEASPLEWKEVDFEDGDQYKESRGWQSGFVSWSGETGVVVVRKRNPADGLGDGYYTLWVPETGADQFLNDYETLADAQELSDDFVPARSRWDREEKASAATKFKSYISKNFPTAEGYGEATLNLPRKETGKPETLKVLPEGWVASIDRSQPEGRQWAAIPPGQIHGRPFGGRHPTKEAALAEALQLVNMDILGKWSNTQDEKQFRVPASHGHGDESDVNQVERIIYSIVTLPDGRRGLTMAELQGDWSHEARKHGTSHELTKESATALGYSVYRAKSNLGTYAYFMDGPDNFRDIPSTGEDTEEAAWNKVFSHIKAHNSFVPDAPLIHRHYELGLKWALRKAAEQGLDFVGWNAGSVVAERYDLSKVVDKVSVYPHSTPYDGTRVVAIEGKDGKFAINAIVGKDGVVAESNQKEFVGKPLSEIIGKDVAKQITEGSESQVIRGEGLKTGGHWATALYDKMLPDFAKKYVKQWGATVETAEIDKEPRMGKRSLEAGFVQEKLPLHIIPITPAMRDAVLGKGQGLFRRGVRLSNRRAAQATPPPSEAAAIAEAYAAGLQIGPQWKHDPNRFFNAAQFGEAEMPPYYDDVNDIRAVAFEAGLRGIEQPQYVRAVRIGSPPKDGRSVNFREQRYEPGVSVLHLEGEAPTDIGTYEMFNPGEKVLVEGWLHYKRGSDGEPILVGARMAREKQQGCPVNGAALRTADRAAHNKQPIDALVLLDSLPSVTKWDIASVLFESVPELAGHYSEQSVMHEIADIEPPLMVKRFDAPVASLRNQVRSTSPSAVRQYVLQLKQSEPPPILVDGRKFIDGSHRLQAAIQAGRSVIDAVDIGPLLRMNWRSWLAGKTDSTHPVRRAAGGRKAAKLPAGKYWMLPNGRLEKLDREHADDAAGLLQAINGNPQDLELFDALGVLGDLHVLRVVVVRDTQVRFVSGGDDALRTLYFDGAATDKQLAELKNLAIENRLKLVADYGGRERVLYDPADKREAAALFAGAAVRVDGTVYGPAFNHYEAWMQAAEAGALPCDTEDPVECVEELLAREWRGKYPLDEGFLTADGRYVDRETAMEMAKDAGHRSSQDWLDSEDLDRLPEVRTAAGYAEDFSKSNNAWDAESAGRYPATKLSAMLGVPAAFIRQHAPKSGEWHHTSKFYNATDYYDLEQVRSWLDGTGDFADDPPGRDKLAGWKAQQQAVKTAPLEKITGISIKYLEWGGTRNHPRATEMTLDNCALERKPGQKFVTVIPPSAAPFKKALTTRGFQLRGSDGQWRGAEWGFERALKEQGGGRTATAWTKDKFWVTPEGELVRVPVGQHHNGGAALKFGLPLTVEGRAAAHTRAIANGWISVLVDEDKIHLSFQPNGAARRTLLDFAAEKNLELWVDTPPRPRCIWEPDSRTGQLHIAARPKKTNLPARRKRELPKPKPYPPNHVAFALVSFPDYAPLDTILVPHDGTEAGVQAAATEAYRLADDGGYDYSHSASQMAATGEHGEPAWVIWPDSGNGVRVFSYATPAGQYALGDVDAYKKDRLQRYQQNLAKGDLAAADATLMEQISEEEDYIKKYRGYIERELAEDEQDRAVHDQGGSLKGIDFRYENSPQGWRDYFEQRRRRIESFNDTILKHEQAAAFLRSKLSKRVALSSRTAARLAVRLSNHTAAGLRLEGEHGRDLDDFEILTEEEHRPAKVAAAEKFDPREALQTTPLYHGYTLSIPSFGDVAIHNFHPDTAHAEWGKTPENATIETLGDMVGGVIEQHTGKKPGFAQGPAMRMRWQRPAEGKVKQARLADLKNPFVMWEPIGYQFDEADLRWQLLKALEVGYDGLVMLTEESLPDKLQEVPYNTVEAIWAAVGAGKSTVAEAERKQEQFETQFLQQAWNVIDWKHPGNRVFVWDEARVRDSDVPQTAEDVTPMTTDQILDLYQQGKLTKQQLREITGARLQAGRPPGRTIWGQAILRPPAERGLLSQPGLEEASFQFHSPNVNENLTYNEAVRRLHSNEQGRFRSVSESIDRQLGVHGIFLHAVGDWSDGAENSGVVVMPGAPPKETILLSSAEKGLAFRQKSVLPFVVDKDAPDRQYMFDVDKTVATPLEIRDVLSRHGLGFRTLLLWNDRTEVIIVDAGGQEYERIKAAARELGAGELRLAKGSATFDFGGDSRASAAQKFRRYIEESHHHRRGRLGDRRHHGRSAGMGGGRVRLSAFERPARQTHGAARHAVSYVHPARLAEAEMPVEVEHDPEDDERIDDPADNESQPDPDRKFEGAVLAPADARRDYLFERSFADDLLAGRKRLNDMPYFRDYARTVDKERGLLPATAQRVLFVGSGPVPASAALYYQRHGIRPDILDIDPHAAQQGAAVLRSQGVTGGKVSVADAARFRGYGAYDAIHLALEAGVTPEQKAAILTAIHEQIKPTGTVILRGDPGLLDTGGVGPLFRPQEAVSTFGGHSVSTSLRPGVRLSSRRDQTPDQDQAQSGGRWLGVVDDRGAVHAKRVGARDLLASHRSVGLPVTGDCWRYVEGDQSVWWWWRNQTPDADAQFAVESLLAKHGFKVARHRNLATEFYTEPLLRQAAGEAGVRYPGAKTRQQNPNDYFYISTGQQNNYYTLRHCFTEATYERTERGPVETGVRERDYHVRNLSIDRAQALAEAERLTGLKFDADFDVEPIGQRRDNIDWSVLQSGKYAGQSVVDLKATDPNYLIWLAENVAATSPTYGKTIELIKSLMAYELQHRADAKDAARQQQSDRDSQRKLALAPLANELLGQPPDAQWPMPHWEALGEQHGVHGWRLPDGDYIWRDPPYGRWRAEKFAVSIAATLMNGELPRGRGLQITKEMLAKQRGRANSKAYNERMAELNAIFDAAAR